MRRSAVLFAIALATSQPARADGPLDAQSRRHNTLSDSGCRCLGSDVLTESACHEPTCKPVSWLRRTGAVLAAIGPGLIVRGAGSYLVHEKRTSKRLLQMGAIGVGGMLVGGLPLGISGGNPYTTPGLPILLVGGGLFFTSWWADIATAAGVSTIGEARRAPPWQVELATLWLHAPYREAGLLRLGGRIEVGRASLGGETLIDAENDIRAGAGEVRVRIRGAKPSAQGLDDVIRDGSRLYARTSLRVHHDDDDRLTFTTGEVEAVGRLDLFHVDRALHGTFVELSTGAGVERVKFDVGGSDFHSLILGTFAWGAYLGNRGEAKLYYDHRRDGIVGGLAAYRAAGFVGSFGAAVDWILDPHWAVHLELDVGNAWLTTFGVRLRGGR